MSTLSFTLGILCGAVVTFAFVFISFAVAMRKENKKKSVFDEDLIMKLFHEYLKETKDDGGGKD